MRRALRALPLLLPLLLLLAAAGCDDTPTDPDRTLSFSGSIVKAQAREHSLPLGSSANVRVRLRSALLTLPETTAPVPTAVLVTLGRATATACEGRTSSGMVAGSVISFGLEAGNYCLTVGDTGSIPENGSVEYSLDVEITE